ncbi:MAG: J domain-containing protein [Alkalispirochaeta sp.]
MQLREAYTILGVEPGFAPEEIRSRYRLLVKELHPDVNGGHGLELGQIIEAYRLIDARMGPFADRAGSAGRTAPVRRSTATTARRPAPPGGSRTPTGRRAATAQPENTSRRRSTTARESAPGGPASSAQQRAPRPDPIRRGESAGDARAVVSLGRIAVSATERHSRIRALRELADSGLRSAGVFIRQCLFDTDKEIADESARLFPLIPGVRGESVLIELFDQLSEAQCLAIVETVGSKRPEMRRFLAYASADPRIRVRRRAMEVLRGD